MHAVTVKGILSGANGMNLYRGCSHGCIYCDARSACYHMDHAFEDIEVKENALELLEQALKRKRKPCMIATGAMTDPYIPLELKLGHMRGALELILKYGFGVALQTKSDRVLRDLDLLREINSRTKAVVQMTLTTYDETLCRILEPHVCTTHRRYEVLRECRHRGIPTVVWLSPLLPWINDTEDNLRGILDYCFDAGVRGIVCFGIGTTLRDGSREPFYAALDRYFPGLKARYVRRYGNAYHCISENHAALMPLFHAACEAHGVMHDVGEIFAYLHDFPEPEQMTLF